MNIAACRAKFLNQYSSTSATRFAAPRSDGVMERAGNAAILPADPLITDHWSPFSRRGGRAVDCAGLENRKAERPREFESHPLRSCFNFRFANGDLRFVAQKTA